MDGLWITLFKNKEFGALVIIALFQVKQYYQSQGRLDLQDEKIKRADEKASEANVKATSANDAIKEIKPKLDDIHGWWKDKYKNAEEKKSEKIITT